MKQESKGEATIHVNTNTKIEVEATFEPDDIVKTFEEFVDKMIGMKTIIDEEVPDRYVRIHDPNAAGFFDEMPFNKVLILFMQSQRSRDRRKILYIPNDYEE